MSVPVLSLTLCQLAKCWMALLLSEKIQISYSCGSDSTEFTLSRIATCSERNTGQESGFSERKINPAQRYQANGSHCEDIAVLKCPKPITKVNLVPRCKHKTAFVGFTPVNNQGEHNNI
ncbi:hypothetical protein TNCV_5055021 [Trichonephila clavipes]|nr:hypothetical protein TNCV_5055021 [Trichonephila clavipes]